MLEAMPLERSLPTTLPNPVSPVGPVFHLYKSLSAALPLDLQSGLGGRLLYAGEIHESGRMLLCAANIAGAASLAASADGVALRAAMRDGIVDFAVTTLEEALRILKNEIRKHQTVSVGVGVEAGKLVEQMLERGVLPDLLPSPSMEAGMGSLQAEQFLSQGARQIFDPSGTASELVSWTLERDFAHWMPRLDACAQSALPVEDCLRQRWLRLAPRYLGRMAQRRHGVSMDASEEARFRSAVAEMMATGTETPAVEISRMPFA